MREKHVTIIRSIVRGVGSYLPDARVTNAELSQTVDTSHEWIVQRTGIEARHIAADDETTSLLGIEAAAPRARRRRACAPADIDLIVVATSTPDYTFPSTATIVQEGLGIHHGAAFDLQAVCTGFVYAVATADNFLKARSHKRALVIGAETFSRILDWEDRTTCVLFGDGAGAVVLEAGEGEGDERGSRRPDLASALGRPPPRQALRRRRPGLDPDDGRSQDGGPRGLPLRGRHGHGRDPRRLRGDAARPPTISTGSCRTRPTGASSRRAPTSSASRRRRW